MESKAKGKFSLFFTTIFLFVIQTLYGETNHKKIPDIIYILQWSSKTNEPFKYWKPKRKSFVAMNCEYQNCYITHKRNYFEDLTNFDAILFNSIDFDIIYDTPHIRSDNQVYIFVSTESAQNRPKDGYFNWFFNYTFTYKLDSDIPYPYLYVRNENGEIVAPKENVQWMDIKDMKAADETVLDMLIYKKVAAAWFVSNCVGPSPRMDYVNILHTYLYDYGLNIDIYGECGEMDCPIYNIDECFERVQTDYYFYLALENSYSEDYVTEKLLTALDNYAVAVVMGGANYTRFVPNGMYLDATKLSEKELAAKMHELIMNKTKYYEYFKWHNHYSYHAVGQSTDTEPLCVLCALMNNMTKRGERRTYNRFTDWWNENRAATNSVALLGHGDPSRKAYISNHTSKNVLKVPEERSLLQDITKSLYKLFEL